MDPDPNLTTSSPILQQGTDRLNTKHKTDIKVLQDLYNATEYKQNVTYIHNQNVPQVPREQPSVRSPQQITHSGSLYSSPNLQRIFSTV